MCAIYIHIGAFLSTCYFFCDWAVFTLSGGEQLGVQYPATKCYSSCPIFRPTSIDAGWCTRPFIVLFYCLFFFNPNRVMGINCGYFPAICRVCLIILILIIIIVQLHSVTESNTRKKV